jgi:hypothetical protein
MGRFEDSPLKIDAHVRDLLEERGIREEDIRQVISFAETGKVFHVNSTTGHKLAYSSLFNVTFWVEYAWEEESIRIVSAYSHRMKILEGFNMPSNKAPAETDWFCGGCGVRLEMAAVKLAYLDESFVADLLSCPTCQRVLISEKDAVEKMALAERMLEDK